jgi:hypothetical protein
MTGEDLKAVGLCFKAKASRARNPFAAIKSVASVAREY